MTTHASMIKSIIRKHLLHRHLIGRDTFMSYVNEPNIEDYKFIKQAKHLPFSFRARVINEFLKNPERGACDQQQNY